MNSRERTGVIPLPVLDPPEPRDRGRSGGGCAARSGCGAPAPADPRLAARVADHPCYSADAHQYYARMHIPVAPGCNIQCHYCNRKFDCVNESRPGVTSALLTPQQALARVKRVAAAIGALKVVGVAGPGEPLANAARTLHALELVRRDCPDLRLCLSTNGLNLLDHVDRIADLGVEHVTVTINMTDPRVGARIYPWVAFRGRRYTGVEAARVLSERQLAGVRALAERNILCKVNSVLIPGINDEHLMEVAHTVRQLGAFMHNVMPLVSDAAHGTHFGLTGQRGPSNAEIRALRDRCEREVGGSMAVMRHCRQCRADAVGLLGEDRGAEFDAVPAPAAPATAPPGTGPTSAPGGAAPATAPPSTGPTSAPGGAAPATAPPGTGPISPPPGTGSTSAPGGAGEIGYDLAGRRSAHAAIEQWRAEVDAARRAGSIATGGPARPAHTVLVAVATGGGGMINQHFGRATEFWVYEAGPRWASLVAVRPVPRSCAGPVACGEPSPVLDATVALLADCAAVLCAQIGPVPHGALRAAGIEPVEVHDLIEPAVAAVGARLATGTPGREVPAR